MIDTLLKKDLPRAYGLRRKNVRLTHWQTPSTFELGDKVACTRCKASGISPERYNCNERVMKIDVSDCTITVVEHEDYISQFNGTNFAEGGTCDYIMFDAETLRKVVFCELGCYSEKYVEKKQEKSHNQVRKSLMRFMKQECGRSFINQFEEKILIFGRRDPAVNPDNAPAPVRGDVRGNMQAFLTNPFSQPKFAVSSEVIEGVSVSFIIVNYPEPYIW